MPDRDLTNVQFPMLNSYPNRANDSQSDSTSAENCALGIEHWSDPQLPYYTGITSHKQTAISLPTTPKSILQGVKNLVVMLFDFHLWEDMGDFPLFVDNESGSLSAHIRLAVHRFFLPNPVSFDHFLVGIRQ